MVKKIWMGLLLGACFGVAGAWRVGTNFRETEISAPPVQVPSALEQTAVVKSEKKADLSVIEKVTGSSQDPAGLEPEILPEKTEEPVKKTVLPEPKPTVGKAPDHKNRTLENLNIMFLGIEDQKLCMLTVYSVNKDHKWKSGAVFVPTETLVPGTQETTMSGYYDTKGIEAVQQVLEENMEISIDYYVKVDQKLLEEVESSIDPIYVNGARVDLKQLFHKQVAPEDEIIMGSLLRSLTKPSVYFGLLPRLVWNRKQYLETDFPVTWSNLWLHYQIARNINAARVAKKILPGISKRALKGELLWMPAQEAWWNTVYEVTQ